MSYRIDHEEYYTYYASMLDSTREPLPKDFDLCNECLGENYENENICNSCITVNTNK